jgi:hypothetical protein
MYLPGQAEQHETALPAPLNAREALPQGSRGAPLPMQLLFLEALPPAVLVDRQHQVIYTHGNTGKYLQLPEGKPDMNLLQMAHADLRSTPAAMRLFSFIDSDVGRPTQPDRNPGADRPGQPRARVGRTPDGAGNPE